VATLMTAVMNVLVNSATLRLPWGEVAFARSVAGIVILGAILRRDVGRLLVTEAAPAWLFGATGTVSILCLFWNLKHANAGTASALSSLSPVFVLVISWSFLDERIRPGAVAGVICACGGALLFNAVHATTPSNIVLVVGCAGAFAAGVSYTSLRRSAQQLRPAHSVFALSVLMLAVTPVTAGQWVVPTGTEIAALAAIGLFSVGQLVFTARSFALIPAAIASGVARLTTVWTVLLLLPLGVIPTAVEWLAYGLVVLGVMIVNFDRRR
jgi:drug/metabolite transporter (DMT)-like permease